MPILQITFALRIPAADFQQVVADAAPHYRSVPGLRWKIWLLDAARAHAGGVYLFDDDASLSAYLAGPLAAQLATAPFLTDLRVRRYDVLEDATALTHGPVAPPRVADVRAA